MTRIMIDGSTGEGGGQVLRSCLALSAVTGQPFSIDNIRAGRKKPGLMRQHRTALLATAEICEAKVTGGELGARQLTFEPRGIRPGEYQFSVGTAGSACLVLQTVLPPLLTAGGPSRLVLEGGTHNPWAPPFDFLDRAYLPLLRRMGPRVAATIHRHGFYPAGGGRFVVDIEPAPALKPLKLLERGARTGRRCVVLTAGLPSHISQREIRRLSKRLSWPETEFEIADGIISTGPGNVICLELQYAEVTEVFTAFGQRGVRVPKVIEPLVTAVRAYLASSAPVGPYLADQLLLPMAMSGGGCFRTVALSRHATTNIEVIETFLEARIKTTAAVGGEVLVEVACGDDLDPAR